MQQRGFFVIFINYHVYFLLDFIKCCRLSICQKHSCRWDHQKYSKQIFNVAKYMNWFRSLQILSLLKVANQLIIVYTQSSCYSEVKGICEKFKKTVNFYFLFKNIWSENFFSIIKIVFWEKREFYLFCYNAILKD